mgnify:CR=1 FL=1
MTRNFLTYKGFATTEANFSTHFAACAGIVNNFAVKPDAIEAGAKDFFDTKDNPAARPYVFLAVVNALNGCDAAAAELDRAGRKSHVQDVYTVTNVATKHGGGAISLLGLLDNPVRKECVKYFAELDRLGQKMSPEFLQSAPVQKWLAQDAELFSKAAAVIFQGVQKAGANQDLARGFVAEQTASFGLAVGTVTPWQDTSGHARFKGCSSPTLGDLCKATSAPSAIFRIIDGANIVTSQKALGV